MIVQAKLEKNQPIARYFEAAKSDFCKITWRRVVAIGLPGEGGGWVGS